MTFDLSRWEEFKAFAATRSLSIQFREDAEFYYMKCADSWFSLSCNLLKAADTSEVADFEANFKASGNKPIYSLASPFASKSYGSKKLYKRVHGVKLVCIAGSNESIYEITYPWVKITGIELTWGEAGDTVSFYVLDSTTGLLTTVPNLVLNQFGFNVNVAKDYYHHKSEFDADIYQTLQLKTIYNSVSAKTVGINFILNELK
ncbi:MAG: hypothetical protein SGI96_21140 [Bacteroidota bacterium]|nr:hypothetical protein [Bacteroidota bacterium]